MNATFLASLLTAFLAGLLGSGHCFGMCGGIASGLGTLARRRPLDAAIFNGGRLLSYMVFGAFAGLFLGGAGAILDVPSWSRWLRLATALLIAGIGVQLLTGWRLLAFIEHLGGRAWARVAPWAARFASRPGLGSRLALGLCWGLLPCGLVYTFLLAAAATGDAAKGAAVMLAFGLGTLPSMLGMTMAAPALSVFLSDPWTRRLVGAGLILLAAWSAVLALASGSAQHHH